MDTGNNGQMLNMNIESIGEVKVLTQGYQAEYGRSSGLQITAVTKSGTNRFRGLGLRHQDRLRLEREQLGSDEERRPEADRQAQTLRLLHRRSGRQAGRQQQAVLLLHARIPADQRRRSTTATRSGIRVPTALERAGDFSQTLDNNGSRCSTSSRTLRPGFRAALPIPAAASRTAASRPDSATACTPPVSRSSSATRCRTWRRRPGRTTTTSSSRRRRSRTSCSSRRSASTTSCRPSCVSPASTRASARAS